LHGVSACRRIGLHFPGVAFALQSIVHGHAHVGGLSFGGNPNGCAAGISLKLCVFHLDIEFSKAQVPSGAEVPHHAFPNGFVVVYLGFLATGQPENGGAGECQTKSAEWKVKAHRCLNYIRPAEMPSACSVCRGGIVVGKSSVAGN
jgi:hypothetical protein